MYFLYKMIVVPQKSHLGIILCLQTIDFLQGCGTKFSNNYYGICVTLKMMDIEIDFLPPGTFPTTRHIRKQDASCKQLSRRLVH